MKKLIFRHMSVAAIPEWAKDPLQAGLSFLLSDGLSKQYRESLGWAWEAIDAVKAAPDNIWTTDEEIAEEILKKIGAKLS